MSSAVAQSQVEVQLFEGAGERRGLGELRVEREGAKKTLPLAGVSIQARVAERVAEVLVEQRFQNPFAEHLEATYIFPLAGGSAVSRFELQVGARVLQGKVKERNEARQDYQRALNEGRRAALLEEERDDVFTVQVGNLPPGEEVIVRMQYAEKLPFFEDGTTELRLPLVVAPRYIAGQPIDTPANAGRGTSDDTNLVPDASRITPPRLAPGFDAKTALAIRVELLHAQHGATGVADLFCSQHAVRSKGGPETAVVTLAREREPLDRDFVLRWRLAQEKVASSLLVHRDASGEGFALLSIISPKREGFSGLPRDVVFVVDRSGSMGGVKMASAARACAQLLETLGPRDRFALQAFDDVVEWMDGKPAFHAADEAGKERGQKWLRTIDARNGTELDQAMGAALGCIAARSDGAARAAVIVLLTDGQVGDESRALKRMQKELGDARVFTVGIDTAVNDGFLKRLAALGGGTSSFVEPGAALEDALQAVAREIGAPLVTDLRVVDEGLAVIPSSAAPARMPDLFEGRAATVSLRLGKRDGKSGKARVEGRFADGGAFSQELEIVELPMPALAQVWARARVADLEDQYRADGDRQRLKQEIVELAVRHTLLTRFTAFVVVDEHEVVNTTGQRREVTQPVEMPASWAPQGAVILSAPAPAGVGGGGPNITRAGMSHAGSSAMAPPPPMAKARKASFGAPAKSALSKMKDLLSSAFDGDDASEAEEASVNAPAAPAQPTPAASAPAQRGRMQREESAADSKAGKAAPVEGLAELRAAFERLQKAWAACVAELSQGRVPPAAELSAARAAVLAALSMGALGWSVPALQALLRVQLLALTAALGQAGAQPAALSQLFAREQPALEAARAELAALGSAAPAGRVGDASIWVELTWGGA